MDGDKFFASETSRQQTRMFLNRLANLSEEGLYLFILYNDSFVPFEERSEFMEKNIFYHQTNIWDSVPYIFPEGYTISSENGKVFVID
jgi:hypothetical protein